MLDVGSWMLVRYFVTGATGFVGGYLARRLRNDGHDVVALVRSPGKAAPLSAIGVEIVEGDITDRASMHGPMRGVDGVFHLAAWYRVGARNKSPAERINVDGTRNVLELVKELEIPKAVYTSTLAVNSDTKGQLVDESYRFTGEHITEYDRTKAVAHEIADSMIEDGLPLVIVMPGVVYGPRDHSLVRDTFLQYLKRKLPVIPKDSGFCWGHVEDIVTGHILAMERGQVGETYIIAGPCHTLVEAMDTAQEITGIKRPPAVPPGLLRMWAPLMGLLEKVLPIPASYTSEGLRTAAGVTYLGDNSKAREELGYDPRPLKEGLAEWLQYEMALLKA